MWNFNFCVSPPPDPLPTDADQTFYWHSSRKTNYFASNYGPLLGDFGQVNDRNIDLVRIASAVLAADRSASRSGSLSRWNSRNIAVRVDVLDIEPWLKVAARLERLLGFLTGDSWYLSFNQNAGPPEQIAVTDNDSSRVVLLSGGADSATGALLSAVDLAGHDKKQTLLSHWSAPLLSPIQSRIVQRIEEVAPNTLSHPIKVHHSRGRRSPTGHAYGRENSTRSRSLLFIALGLAAASVNGVQLWIPENGYASINPPLSKSRRGSLSTKTTHPKFFRDLRSILQDVGAHCDFTNPYASMTKGEMFAKVKSEIGANGASSFLSSTNSCSHTGAKTYGVAPNVCCGVCFGCVLRKASFKAANLDDRTTYLEPATDEQHKWRDSKSVVPAMHDFLASTVTETDMALLQLPPSMALADALALVERGRHELRGLAL